MSLSVDNLIGVQPTTTSSTNLQCQQIDVYNGTTNFHRLTSSASAPLQTINIPNASGTMTLNTATQTITNKMNHAQVGSQTDPSYSFTGDTDTGMYRYDVNTIGFTTAGINRLGISDVDIVSFLPIKSDSFKGLGVGGPGAVVFGNPSSTSGMYFDINRINFSTNSVQRLAIQDASITCNQNLIIPSGTSSNCGLQFSGSASTGLHNTSGLFYFTLGGTNMMRFQSAQVFSERPHIFTNGSASIPAIASSSYGTTGFYWTSGPVLNVAVSGSQAVGFETGGLRLYGSTAGNNSPYAPSLLGYYQEVNYTSTFTPTAGTLTLNPSINFQLTRIGNIVKLTFQGMTSPVKCNTTCYYDSTQTFPTQFQQKSGQSTYFYINATISGSVTQIILQVDTRFRIQTTSGTGLPANVDISVSGFSVSWSILV